MSHAASPQSPSSHDAWAHRASLHMGPFPRLATRGYLVIPARMASTRLPRKMLLAAAGKPLIQHTYESAARAQLAAGVCVATDDEEIYRAVEAFGGRAVMTRADHQSGTDRVAEVAEQLPDADILVNVQGDEPEISGDSIDRVIRLLAQHPAVPVATLATPIRRRGQLDDPACVKVVFDAAGRALYFSRTAIPYAGIPQPGAGDGLPESEPHAFFQHVGIYAYRREFLLRLTKLPPSRLEKLERLEQLRVLEAGFPIVVDVVDEPTAGIDTAADYEAFVRRARTG